MQQRSTEQLNNERTVDSRRRLTYFKMLVHQCHQSSDSPSNYCQMLNRVLKVSTGTCQQFVADAVKISNIFWIFEFYKVVQQHITGEVEIFVVYQR